MYSTSANGTDVAFEAYTAGNATSTIKLTADGTAKFAGGNINLYSNGAVDAFRAGNNAADPIFNALSGVDYASRTSVAQINADGSAAFANTVQVGGNAVGGAALGTVIRSGDINLAKDDFGGNHTSVAQIYDLSRDDASIPAAMWLNDSSLHLGVTVLDGAFLPQTNTISLNADGTASFTGKVSTNEFQVGVDYDNIYMVGGAADGSNPAVMGVYARPGADPTDHAFFINTYPDAGTTATQQARINYDGSALFTGAVSIGNYNSSGNAAADRGILLGSDGGIFHQTASGSDPVSPCYQFYSGNSLNIEFTNGGSATFGHIVQGALFIADNNGGGFAASRIADSLPVWRAGSTFFDYDNEATWTSNINADGSASFDANVSVNQYLTVTNTAFSSDAKVQIQGDNDVAIGVYPPSPGATRTIELKHDGSASFAGADFNISDEGEFGAKAEIFREPNSIALSIRSTNERGIDAVSILGNGSADFASRVIVGEEPFGGAGVGSKLSLGSCQATAAATNNDVWLGYVAGTATATSRIGADGSATFDGSLSALGPYSTTTDSRQFVVNSGGVFLKCKSDDTSSFTAFNVVKSSNNGSNASSIASINGDGSATFDGTASFASNLFTIDSIGGTGGRYFQASSSGNVDALLGLSGGYCLTLYDAGVATTQVTPEGNATFAGSLRAASLTDGSTTKTMTDVLSDSAGAVLQVLSASTTDVFSTNNSLAYQAVPGLQVKITPTSASSKILISVSIGILSGGANAAPCIGIIKNGGLLDDSMGTGASGANVMFSYYDDRDTNQFANGSGQYMDTAGTTSEITYDVGLLSVYNNLVQINRRIADDTVSAISTLTIMEIA